MRSELLHQMVYNFQDMTISDQCMSIQIFLKRLISIKQQAVVSKKLFALQKNFNYSILTDLKAIMAVIHLFW